MKSQETYQIAKQWNFSLFHVKKLLSEKNKEDGAE